VSLPDGVSAAPGTAAAFETFWQKVTDASGWLDNELGAATSYEPTRLAVLTIPPVEASAGITPNETAWPLSTPFASFGAVYGGTGGRCMVVSGADVTRLVPVVKQSNQLTRFVDSSGVKNSLVVRVSRPRRTRPLQLSEPPSRLPAFRRRPRSEGCSEGPAFLHQSLFRLVPVR